MAHRVKLQLAMLASHARVLGQVAAVCFQSSFLTVDLGKQKMTQLLGPLQITTVPGFYISLASPG